PFGDGGECQVTLTFADGTASTVSLGFAEQWEVCGSDPHGCGQLLIATPATTAVTAPCADGGADAATAD
ncbi:MAG TPA: hypothetical protein VHS09_08955, partial [Polyangiaceae bacterium]|nr:hypothetical protein [Polyangiaceae bacterium]